MITMDNYLFIDDELGEEFLVNAYNLNEANEIADTYFPASRWTGEILSDFEAECCGLDVY